MGRPSREEIKRRARQHIAWRLEEELIEKLGGDPTNPETVDLPEDAYFGTQAPEDAPEEAVLLGLDSLGLVEMMMDLEDEFEIEIPDQEAETLITVGLALDYLEKKLANAEG